MVKRTKASLPKLIKSAGKAGDKVGRKISKNLKKL